MTTVWHPELVALELIYETLRSLPDRPTRHRVLTYAKHLIETEPEIDDQQQPDAPHLRVVDRKESADR